MQHMFFQGFGQPRPPQQQISTTPELQHNVLVLEIANNWEFVLELFEKIEKGQVDLVQQIEGEWINFLSTNKLDVKSFNNEEDFIVRNIKPLGQK